MLYEFEYAGEKVVINTEDDWRKFLSENTPFKAFVLGLKNLPKELLSIYVNEFLKIEF